MITYRRPSLLSGPLAASTGVAVWRPRAAYNENDVIETHCLNCYYQTDVIISSVYMCMQFHFAIAIF